MARSQSKKKVIGLCANILRIAPYVKRKVIFT